MKLTTLRIRNYRCYQTMEFAIDSMHALVGSNNAGKSTVLRALDLLFNPSNTKINEESFYLKDTSRRIEIEGIFKDLTDFEKAKLSPYLRPDGAFQLMRTAEAADDADGPSPTDEDGDTKFKILQHYCRPQPTLAWLNPALISGDAIASWWAEKATLIFKGHSFADVLGKKRPTVAEWKDQAGAFATSYLTADDVADTWTANPQGYAGVLKATLPQFVLIPAVRDVADESKVTKTNPFGRLIAEIMRTLDSGLRDELRKSLSATTFRLNRDGKDERLPRVVEIESTIKAFLGEVMPADLEVQFQAPTLEILLSTPKIYVDDGFKGSIEGKGHGMQRAVIFSILRAYAKLVTTRAERDKRQLIVGIEEPELYMHPTAQRTVRRVLRTIADGGDQVLFSTHSPLMVDVTYFDEIVRIEAPELASGPGLPRACPKAFQLPAASLIADLEARHPPLKGTVSPASIRDRYSHAYTSTRNEGFFARRVILVEGQTEVYALPLYAGSAAEAGDLDSRGVAVVECGGKGQMDRLYRVFNELGIVCYPIFDYDIGNTDKGVRRDTDELLALLQRPDIKDPAAAVITNGFACFSRDWEADLRGEIPDYEALKADAKESLGLKENSKPLIARYIAEKLISRTPPIVPPTILAIVAKALAKGHPGTCLKAMAAQVEVAKAGS